MTQLVKQQIAAVQGWQPPPWLEGWTMEHDAPVSKEVAQSALREVRQALFGSSAVEIATRLEETLALWETALPANWDAQAPVYLRALSDLPPDLLDKALIQVERTCKFFPKPADIIECVESDMHARSAAVRMLEARVAFGRWPEPKREPPTEAQREKVRALLAGHGIGMTDC